MYTRLFLESRYLIFLPAVHLLLLSCMCVVTNIKKFSKLYALGLFDAVLKFILEEDPRLSELNLDVSLSKVLLKFHCEY